MFTQETLYPSFFEKKSLSTLQTFCKTFTFYAFLLFLTVSEVCNISKKYRLPNKSGKKYFYTRHLTRLHHFKKTWTLHCRSFQKQLLFYQIFISLHVDEVYNISNKYRPPSNLVKHLHSYTRDFTSILYFEKNGLFRRKNFWKHLFFLPHFQYFWQWVRFVMFQINSDLLTNLLKSIFTQDTLHLSFLKKNALSIKEVFRKSHFLINFY